MLKSVLLGVASLGLAAGAANAAVLTLDTSASTSLQQQQNRPCVIGDPSCHNPSGFDLTVLDNNQSTYTNVQSPSYTVGQIRTLVGNTFSVGIDVNTQGNQQPLATEVLDSFSLSIGGTQQFSFNTPTQLHVANPGNGFSDDMLNGFDLSAFPANAAAQFAVSYHNATAGREEFFLVASPGTQPGGGVPEPAALVLLGLGLLNLARRRRG